jgi:TPR repeat protein
MRKGWIAWGLIGVAAVAAADAAPADDHQRGLQAYRQGDIVAAMGELRKAADAGHVPSQTLLAFILDRADFAGEATRLYRAAAERDDAEGHAGLAAALVTGRGIAKDEKQAWLHFSKAAELGHEASIDLVAEAYRKGQFGVAADPVAAAQWRARGDALRQQRAAASAPAKR